MPKFQSFSVPTRELTNSLSIAPSQKKDALTFTIRSTSNPQGIMSVALQAPSVETLATRLMAALPDLKAHYVSHAQPAPPVG